MSDLAILGGAAIRTTPFEEYNPFGEDDRIAVSKVIERGLLSGFVGSKCDDFYGGPEVLKLEQAWKTAFKANHAVSMNSATSCLIAAITALGIGPGDEVIVTPFTMSATIAAILFNQAIPVFADVDVETFNLDPAAVEAEITEKTRAILVVHLFGQAANMSKIIEVAKRHNLAVIEDNAQSLGANTESGLAGTIGDIGVFSLNRHKLIQSGEGGICVTNDADLALKLQLIRNHGENAAKEFGLADASIILGYNFRMTELEAAVANVQFTARAKVSNTISEMALYINEGISGLPGIRQATIKPGFNHVYMHHTLLFDEAEAGVPRTKFVAALNAEGIPVWEGYLEPMYLLPIFTDIDVHFESQPAWRHFLKIAQRQKYKKGLCPNAEFLHTVMINHDLHRPPNSLEDMADIVDGFKKVCANLSLL